MTEVLTQLGSYLDRRASLRSLARWVALGTWESAQWSDARATALANELELALAEFSNGSGSQDDLRATLQELRERFSAPVLFGVEAFPSVGRADQRSDTVSPETEVGTRWVIPVAAA